MSDLYFNEENDYSEEHSSENEDFRSTILQPFLFERVVNRNRNRKKRVVTRDMTKKTQHIHASAADLLHIRI